MRENLKQLMLLVSVQTGRQSALQLCYFTSQIKTDSSVDLNWHTEFVCNYVVSIVTTTLHW